MNSWTLATHRLLIARFYKSKCEGIWSHSSCWKEILIVIHQQFFLVSEIVVDVLWGLRCNATVEMSTPT